MAASGGRFRRTTLPPKVPRDARSARRDLAAWAAVRALRTPATATAPAEPSLAARFSPKSPTPHLQRRLPAVPALERPRARPRMGRGELYLYSYRNFVKALLCRNYFAVACRVQCERGHTWCAAGMLGFCTNFCGGGMFDRPRRREFLKLIGSVAAAPLMPSLSVRAQQRDRMRRVGVLLPAAADDAEYQTRIGAFLQGLALLGWTHWRQRQG